MPIDIDKAVTDVLKSLQKARSRPEQKQQPPNINDWQVGGTPKDIQLRSAQQQVGAVNSQVATRPSVRVLDRDGNGLPNVHVRFAVSAGGGTVRASTQRTDANGDVTVGQWRLGPTEGKNILIAKADGLPDKKNEIEFTAIARLPESISCNNRRRLGGRVNEELADILAVRVLDREGNPVPAVQITFAVSSGGGSVERGTVATDANGVARLGGWTLGPTPGQNKRVAIAQGLESKPVDFTAIAI